MITDDDVDTLLFDILGTVVDEAGSMRAELAAALGEVGAGEQVQALLTGWEQRFATLVRAVARAEWTDDVSRFFGEVKADLERRGARVDDFDLAIAAHALRSARRATTRAVCSRAAPGVPPGSTNDRKVDSPAL